MPAALIQPNDNYPTENPTGLLLGNRWGHTDSYTISNLNYLSLNWKAPPFGVADYVIFDLENHIIPSHIDLHIKNFKAAP